MKDFKGDNKPNRINQFHKVYLEKNNTLKFPIFSIIEFNLHGSCNRRCAFCPRVSEEKWPNLPEEITVDLFDKIIKDLKDVNYHGRVAFSGFSEPFLHSKLDYFIKKISTDLPGSSPEIITNGDYLTEENLKKLFNNGLKYMYVSLYTNKRTFDRLVDLREKCKLTEDQFEIRPRNLGSKNDFGLNLNNRAGAVDYTLFGKKQTKILPLKQACYYPMYTIFVDYNGDCLICPDDWDKRNVIGNVKNKPIKDIWVDHKFHEVRKKLLNRDRNHKPCDKCDVNGLLNGVEFAKNWKEFYKEK